MLGFFFQKPKGADRKLKTDREKIDKKTLQDRDKYQPSHDTTLLKEVRLAAVFIWLRYVTERIWEDALFAFILSAVL